jgi:hypothetical protein
MNESKEFPTKKGYFSDGQIELPMPTQESPSQTLSIALFMKALQFFCATFMFVRLQWSRGGRLSIPLRGGQPCLPSAPVGARTRATQN